MLALLLGACATTPIPLATPEENAAGKQFRPPAPGLTALYVFRETGGGPNYTISAGERTLGVLAGHDWLRVELPPATYAMHCAASKYSDLVSTRYVVLKPDAIRYLSVTLWGTGLSCRVVPQDSDFDGSILRGSRIQELPAN
jgi:hypothetical protein